MQGNSIALVSTMVIGSAGLGVVIGYGLDLSPILCSLFLLNINTFAIYGLDKHRAMRGGSRIPERTLLALAVCMASPGALLAMKCFRHKTLKGSFLLKIGCLVLLQIILLVALSSEELGIVTSRDRPVQNRH